MLVEREEELQILTQAHAAVTRGRGRVVIVSGGVASGKTDLLHGLVDRIAGTATTHVIATGSRAERTSRFGVLRQLLPGPAQLDIAAQNPTDDVGEVIAGACTALIELAARSPLVVIVDDVQFADQESLDALLYLQRRIQSSPILLVIAEWTLSDPAYDAFRAQITRQANIAHIQLAPLSVAAIATLLRATHQLADDEAHVVAGCYHALTGGNPLLVNALTVDHRAALRRGDTGDVHKPADGGAMLTEFRHAVIACLRRFDENMLDIARSVAVLDDHTMPGVLDQLLDIPACKRERAVRALESAGLLDHGRFRHPVVRTVVLDGMASPKRAALHLRTAELLYRNDARATQIAVHLVAADRLGVAAGQPWTVDVLRRAAQEDLVAGRVEMATQRLDLAARNNSEGADVVKVISLLLRTEWHSRPSSAARHLDVLESARARGRMSHEDELDLAKFLLWYGNLPALARAMASLTASMSTDTADTSQLSLAVRWLGFLCPPATPELPALPHPAARLRTPWSRAADMLELLGSRGSCGEVTDIAEALLANNPIGEHTFDLSMSALVALLHADAHKQVVYWCETLLADPVTSRSHTWAALLRAVYGAALLRQGELPRAAELTAITYDLLSPQGWGVVIGMPLGIRVGAATRAGQHDTAAALLSLPVPDTMFDTQFGLTYLYERGLHHLATDRARTALSDFERCGDLMRAWHIDLRATAPWRVGAAEAHVALGDVATARALAQEHLDQMPADDIRARGMAMRIIGVVSPPAERIRALEESVELLDSCGDPYESARSLIELSHAHTSVDDTEQARAAGRRAAVALARMAGSDTPNMSRPVLEARAPIAGQRSSAALLHTLSDAELRVAALAALGHTNKEIGTRLYITVSTVEQHLTRVYRKLNVTRRKDLPPSLRQHDILRDDLD